MEPEESFDLVRSGDGVNQGNFHALVFRLLDEQENAVRKTEEDRRAESSLAALGFPSAEDLLSNSVSDRTGKRTEGAAEAASNKIADKNTASKENVDGAFKSEKPTARELELLKGIVKPEQIEKIKAEINKNAEDPREVILRATENRDNRVIGLGEWHVTPNGLRTLAETMMPDFKKNGITHLAVEIHKDDQPLLDRFAKGDKEAGEQILKTYGVLGADSLRLMAEAVKNGIKLVAVDGDFKVNRNGSTKEDITDQETQARDNHMAKSIKGILDSDEKNRVLFLVGAAHLERADKMHKPAAAQLRENGIRIATFGSHLEGESTEFTTPEIVKSLSRPVAVDVSRTEHLKDFPATTDKNPTTVGRHDFAVFLPKDASLKILEKVHGKDSPKLLPDLEALTIGALRANNKQSEELMKRTLDIAKKAFGENSKEIADMYERFGRASQGEVTVGLHLASMNIREKLDGGKPSKDYARSAHYVVDLYLQENKGKEAVKVFERAAGKLLSTKDLGPQISDFLERTNHLNHYARDKEDVSTRISILEKRVELKEKNAFPHGATYDERTKIAGLYERQGNTEAAEKNYRSASAEAKTSEQLFDSRRNLAKILNVNEKSGEAEKLLVKNYESAVRNPKSFFAAFSDLAKQLEAAGRKDEAAKIFREGMSNWETGVTANHRGPSAADREFLSNYANFLKQNGNETEAGKVAEKAKFARLSFEAINAFHKSKNDPGISNNFEAALALLEKGATTQRQSKFFLQSYADFLEQNKKTEEAKAIRARVR